MKRRFKLKSFILTGTLTIILTLLGTTNSKAVLQANPTTHASPVNKAGASWITEIRQMETVGQTMGLSETLNGLNATSTSNKIDVHMMLPTEYEAVAILSASGYGNSKKLTEESDALKRTTTGNSTGVYFTGNRAEVTASYRANGNNKYNYCNINAYHTGSSSNPVPKAPWGWHGGNLFDGDWNTWGIQWQPGQFLDQISDPRGNYVYFCFDMSGIFSVGNLDCDSYVNVSSWGSYENASRGIAVPTE